jgi:putative membrane protein
MRNTLMLSLILSTAIVFAPAVHSAEKGASKAEGAKGSASEADRQFVVAAAAAGMAEVDMGKLAAQKGSTEKVRNVGERMVNDHSKAHAELKKAAQAAGLSVPAKPSAEHQKHMATLHRLSGQKFDREYLRIQDQDHDKAVALFKKQAQGGQNPGLRKFASSTLPTLERHKKMVDEAKASGNRKDD